MKFQEIEVLLESKLQQLAAERINLKRIKTALAAAQCELGVAQQAQQVLQAAAQAVQQHAHKQISNVVSKCLEAVFDEPYRLHIVFEQKRGKTEARLTLTRDGMMLDDPINETGGGVLDIAAFALRLACLVLEKPARRKLLVLDEPMKFVSAQYRERVRLLIETLAQDMGVQFIIVTHIDELKTGTIVEIEK